VCTYVYIVRTLRCHSSASADCSRLVTTLSFAACCLFVLQFKSIHGKIGLVLFMLLILTLLSGRLRCMGIENRGNAWFGTNYDRLQQVCISTIVYE
jgi:hypothetical protein